MTELEVRRLGRTEMKPKAFNWVALLLATEFATTNHDKFEN